MGRVYIFKHLNVSVGVPFQKPSLPSYFSKHVGYGSLEKSLGMQILNR